MRGYKRIYQGNRLHKKEGEAKLIFNRADFRPRLVRRDNEGHYKLIKGTIHQDGITILNMYVSNVSAH
jgi:hypothetical protein